jgi:hypothetical protein
MSDGGVLLLALAGKLKRRPAQNTFPSMSLRAETCPASHTSISRESPLAGSRERETVNEERLLNVRHGASTFPHAPWASAKRQPGFSSQL